MFKERLIEALQYYSVKDMEKLNNEIQTYEANGGYLSMMESVLWKDMIKKILEEETK